MTGRPSGWHVDPYPQHDPVFPVLDADASAYLAPARRKRRDRPGRPRNRAAVGAITGFLAVVLLAALSPTIGASGPTPVNTRNAPVAQQTQAVR